MKNFKCLSLLAIMVMFVLSIQAQTDLSKGHIKQEITDVASDDDQVAMQLEMMKGSTTNYHFNDAKNLMSMSMMGGMVEVKTLYTVEGEKIDLYFNAMGQKMLVQSNKAEMEAEAGDQAEALKNMQVTLDKEDKKEILGYSCYKATIAMPDGEKGMSMTAYISEDVKADPRLIQNLQYVELPGFPLELTVNMGPMTMTTTTVEISDKLDDSVFNISDEGYKKMTFKEFMDAMGGMGGMGF